MKLLTSATIVLLMLTASAASAEVKVTIQNGLVTVVAKDATVRQILAEWARVGEAKVVNAERLPGGPVNMELTNMPEAMVLDTLLRGAAGYVAAPRPEPVATLSTFDRVIVMPTSSAPRGSATPPPPTFQQPQFAPQPINADDDQDDRPQPGQPTPNPRGPVFNTFPQQPQVINPQTGQPVVPPQAMPNQFPSQFPNPNQVPNAAQDQIQRPAQQAPMATPTPSAPFGGVAVPGMVAPSPNPQPGVITAPQPGQVTQPGQPVRRPGGQH